MSLLKRTGMKLIKRGLPRVAKLAAKVSRFIPGPIGAGARIIGTAATALGLGAAATKLALPGMRATGGLPVLRSVGGAVIGGGRALVHGGRALITKYPKSARALAELGLFAAGGMVFNAVTGEPVGIVSRRRMNPLNHRALRRAMSRVKSARKICAQVERLAGPRRRAVRAAPCPPARR